ncbi:hypothetical protein L1987_86804 [Smallanthus sonchifolius]|uniref:Uncharacterized protein n=1 Tax=Smallanthus sonchifolius TaxID=185202 RepID=A0ACB8Y121_9ASTR|nr:hypothetical protein L1987_86804 [Smallanthus sonchifolius]
MVKNTCNVTLPFALPGKICLFHLDSLRSSTGSFDLKILVYTLRNTYKLKVYVDDGSLISEILIDHNIVQKKIGYSPKEINTALSSPDPSRVHDMKNIMKQFQVYLVNFEGLMVVRINEASSLPVAIEMQQGCSLSDA